MVAKITQPGDIHRPVYYNENKVKEGVAELIGANGFLKNAGDLSLHDKLQRFDRLHELNDATYKTLHISLNFAPSEQLKEDPLRQIAADYMAQIGFGDQPYLVYRHDDAGHNHIHIVTTAIREDGTRIDFHNIGRNESEAARKSIEQKYHLVKAEEQQRHESKYVVRPLKIQKLQYGKGETKRGITNVLDAVLPVYKYSSLAELNAILSLYNVRADPGEPGGRISNNKGLLYRVVDEAGNHIGKPVKASAISSKPTLAYLEGRFGENGAKSRADIKRVKNAIDWIMVTPPASLKAFTTALKDEHIHTVLRQNKTGLVYGLTFVDTKAKSVLNGSDIGKDYTAKRLLEKLGLPQQQQPHDREEHRLPTSPPSQPSSHNSPADPAAESPGEATEKDNLLDTLMDAEQSHEKTPWQLLRDKKKKKPNRNR